MDEHLSTQQVGWVIGHSPGTVRDRIQAGEIDATTIVDGYRIPKAEVLRLARERIEAEAGRKLSPTARSRTMCRTPWASSSCTTASSWSATPSSAAWTRPDPPGTTFWVICLDQLPDNSPE